MRRVIKYAALLFALVLAATIIGGCLSLGVSLVQNLRSELEYSDVQNNGNNSIWHRTEEGDVVFLGVKFGGEGKVKSGSELFAGADINSLDIEVGSCKLVVETWESDSISVEYENIPEEYKIFVDDETLVIEKENQIVFRGVTFNETPMIHVKVPATKTFRQVDVDSGSGSAKLIGLLVDDLNLDNGSGGLGVADVTTKTISVGSGSGGVNISGVVAKKSVFNSGSGAFIVQDSELGVTTMDAGSGFVNFEKIVAENFVLDTGSGRADVSGILTGNCFFESGSGSLNVVVYGEEGDYNFRTDMGSGSFYLNGRKEGKPNMSREHANAKNLLVFDAGSGRVSLEFKAVPSSMTDSAKESIESGAGEDFER